VRAWTVVALLVAPHVAGADHAAMKPEARTHLDAGSRAYELQDYDAAIAEFKAGYEIDPRAEFLYAIGQAYRMKSDCEHAVRSYEAVLRAPDGKAFAEAARQNIERCPRTAPAEPPPPQVTPPSPTPPAPTPIHRSAPVAADPPWYRDWTGHALVIGGLTLASGGAIAWQIGRDEATRTHDARDYEQWLAASHSASRAETLERVGVAVGAIGFGIAIAGIVHYAWPGRRVEPGPGGVALRF
jgi:tetratricopeptide (TPR) repeat protein